jgi:hypothetical protein
MEDPSFEEGFKKYVDSVRSNCYMFEVNKCCGYSEIVPAFKNATCADLYRNIMCQFDIKPQDNVKLYTKDSTGNMLVIQNNEIPIRNIIIENPNCFKPVYSLPTQVVYKLLYECQVDGQKCCCNSYN